MSRRLKPLIINKSSFYKVKQAEALDHKEKSNLYVKQAKALDHKGKSIS